MSLKDYTGIKTFLLFFHTCVFFLMPFKILPGNKNLILSWSLEDNHNLLSRLTHQCADSSIKLCLECTFVHKVVKVQSRSHIIKNREQKITTQSQKVNKYVKINNKTCNFKPDTSERIWNNQQWHEWGQPARQLTLCRPHIGTKGCSVLNFLYLQDVLKSLTGCLSDRVKTVARTFPLSM